MSSQIQIELQDWLGNDDSIAHCAWTSSTLLQNKDKRSQDDVERIVKMLADSGHSVPFESVVMRFWIKMPIATDRQFMTHRVQSANGMSARYRTMPSEWLEVPDDVNDIIEKLTDDVWKWHMTEQYDKLCLQANQFYNGVLSYTKGIEKLGKITNAEYKRVREFYRGVLPQHNMTERVTTINLRSFCNFQRLRNTEHAQPEIKHVAELMLEEVKKRNVAPIAIKALESKNWMC